MARRVKASPSPATHHKAVIRSILSMPGGLFMAFFALLLMMGEAHMLFRQLAMIFLFIGAVRLAGRAMSMQGDEIDFPLIEADDTIVNVFLFIVLFFTAPTILISLTIQDGLVPAPIAIPVSLLLYGYAPLALVLMLRSGTLAGMFAVPTGVKLLRDDIRGYGFLLAMVLVTFGLSEALLSLWDASRVPVAILVLLLVVPTLGFLVPLCFGLCGLYIRSKARLLKVPCDDGDWERLAPRIPNQPSAPGAASTGTAPPTQPVSLTPISPADAPLPAVTGALLEEPQSELSSAPPVVTGALLDEHRAAQKPEVPAGIEFGPAGGPDQDRSD